MVSISGVYGAERPPASRRQSAHREARATVAPGPKHTVSKSLIKLTLNNKSCTLPEYNHQFTQTHTLAPPLESMTSPRIFNLMHFRNASPSEKML